jgi:hypothetical protein
MKIEHRTILSDSRITRADEPAEGSIGTIEGYAALFNVRSELLGGFFFEEILPGAFDDVLEDDVRALIDHESGRVIGRSSSKTLRVGVDEKGLAYSVDLPDTGDARDLRTLIDRGDVRESSFGFEVGPGGSDWAIDKEGRTIRTVSKVQRLWDVSPVAFPAYADTTIALRSLRSWQEKRLPPDDPTKRSDTPAPAASILTEEELRSLKTLIQGHDSALEELRGKIGIVEVGTERMHRRLGAFLSKYRPSIDRLLQTK